MGHNPIATRTIPSRTGNNNLFPANGVLSVPNLTGGCTCNYTPTSLSFAPQAVLDRPSD